MVSGDEMFGEAGDGNAEYSGVPFDFDDEFVLDDGFFFLGVKAQINLQGIFAGNFFISVFD